MAKKKQLKKIIKKYQRRHESDYCRFILLKKLNEAYQVYIGTLDNNHSKETERLENEIQELKKTTDQYQKEIEKLTKDLEFYKAENERLWTENKYHETMTHCH